MKDLLFSVILLASIGAFAQTTVQLDTLSSDYYAGNLTTLMGKTDHTVHIRPGAQVVLSDATIKGGIVCEGSANIAIYGLNVVKGDSAYAGIQVGGENTTLTIEGTGFLNAEGGFGGAGIGLGAKNDDEVVRGGNIVIEGGYIVAKGGSEGDSYLSELVAGIGNGKLSFETTAYLGDVTIKGGSVYGVKGIGRSVICNARKLVAGKVTIYDKVDFVQSMYFNDDSYKPEICFMHDKTDVTENVTKYFNSYFSDPGSGSRMYYSVGKKDEEMRAVSIVNGIHGKLSVNRTSAKSAARVTVNITPDEGYKLDTLVITDAYGAEIVQKNESFVYYSRETVSRGSDMQLKKAEFTMPSTAVTISAKFVPATAILDVESGVLSLRDSIQHDDIWRFASNSLVKYVIAEEGSVLPASMSYVFGDMKELEVIDFSRADASNLWNLSFMLGDECHKLHTIYVNTSWDIQPLIDAGNGYDTYLYRTFGYETFNLTGANGTTVATFAGPNDYPNSNYQYIETSHDQAVGFHAVIDREGQPGYLTGAYTLTMPAGFKVVEDDETHKIGKRYLKGAKLKIGAAVGKKIYISKLSNADILDYADGTYTIVVGENDVVVEGIEGGEAQTAILNEDTGVLTLMGNVRKEDMALFRNNEKVTSIVALDGAVLPAESEGLFKGMAHLQSIDFTKMDASKVENAKEMFMDDSLLTTIYVTPAWNMAKVTQSENMFLNCNKIKGGFGMPYVNQNLDATYARVYDLDGTLVSSTYMTGVYSLELSGEIEIFQDDLQHKVGDGYLLNAHVVLKVPYRTGYSVNAYMNGNQYYLQKDTFSVYIPPQNTSISVNVQKWVTNPDITISSIPDQWYTGEPIKPKVTVMDGNVDITDECVLEYLNNTEVGTGVVVVYGKGAYYNDTSYKYNATTVIYFNIIDPIVISAIPDQVYTGDSIKPEVVVKTYDGTDVTDQCQFEYSNNLYVNYATANGNSSKPTVKITGTGACAITRYVYFSIEPKEVDYGSVQYYEGYAPAVGSEEVGNYIYIDGNYTGTEMTSIPKEIVVKEIEYDRDVQEGKYTTLSLPFAAETEYFSGVAMILDFAKVSQDENGEWQVQMKVVWSPDSANKTLESYHPYLFLGNEDEWIYYYNNTEETVLMPTPAEPASVTKGDWSFVSATSYKKWSKGDPELGSIYGFAAQEQDGAKVGQFVKVGAGAFIRPNRAFLRYEFGGSPASYAPRPAFAPAASTTVASIHEDLPENMDVLIVSDEETTVIGRLNIRTGEYQMNRNFDLKGRKVGNKPKARGAYYGKMKLVK